MLDFTICHRGLLQYYAFLPDKVPYYDDSSMLGHNNGEYSHYSSETRSLTLKGLMFQGVWAQIPYYIRLLGYFDAKGMGGYGSMYPPSIYF